MILSQPVLFHEAPQRPTTKVGLPALLALCRFHSGFADLRPQCLDLRFSSLASDKKVVSGLRLVLSAPPTPVGRELVSALHVDVLGDQHRDPSGLCLGDHSSHVREARLFIHLPRSQSSL